jgi:hypothetical protein
MRVAAAEAMPSDSSMAPAGVAAVGPPFFQSLPDLVGGAVEREPRGPWRR